MHTLHIIGSKSLGGAERWFLRLTSALAENGISTERLIRQRSELAELRHDISCHELPLRTVWDPISRWQISRHIARRSPDIVQTYMGRATRLTHLPPEKGVLHVARLGGYYKLNGYRHAHAWLGNTKGICDYLIRSGFPSQKVFHLSNFVETPVLAPHEEVVRLRSHLGLSEEDLVLLTPGRFVPVKGHTYLMQAMAEIPYAVRGRKVYLVLLGNGPLEAELRRQAQSLDIEDRIIWPGWQIDPGIYYQMADLVVFPSLEQETLGNVVLEAWSYAKAVVCTAFRGAMEITRHGEDVWRVPCRDPQKLALGVVHVLKNEDLMMHLGHNGWQRIERDFKKSKIVNAHIDLYRTLLQ